MVPDTLRGKRILVVEDDPLLAMAVEDVLRHAGADIAGPADTLNQAEELVAEDRLSAAILDIRLYDQEVWPVARQLAENGVPFLFYSGHFDRSTLPAEYADHPILTKPARSIQIVAALARLTQTH
jgi:DNA-binding response OmpR family regulator